MLYRILKNKLIALNPLNKLSYIRQYYQGMATIFMLHRVSYPERSKLPSTERLKVSPDFLDSFINSLLSDGYEVITLDELIEILCLGKNTEKKIIFTIDDGYLDNYTVALPIFEKYEVPFTIYVSTSFPDRTAILWWYILENILINHDSIALGDDSKYYCPSILSKRLTFAKIRRRIQSIQPKNFLSELECLFKNYEIDFLSPVRELALSWQHVQELSEHPLVTIGGHTINHYALSQISEEEAKNEIMGANERISSFIDKPIKHFAYPFGTEFEVGRRECDLAKKLGIKSAVTTRYGNIFSEHAEHLECLPRVGLNNQFDMKTLGRMTRSKIVTL